MRLFTFVKQSAYVMLFLFLPVCLNAQWTTVGASTFSTGATYNDKITVDANGTPYVVYQDGAFAGATVMKYNGSSWVTVGSAGFTAGEAQYTTIAIDASGTPYVAYMDVANSNKASVMKYNGSSWVTVGSAGFSAGQATYTSIAIDASGTPYVGYRDNGNGAKATVMKYNGSSWVNVGSAGFSSTTANFTTLSIDPSGTPYIAYSDNTNYTNVMKYNGSSWVVVGSAGFSNSLVQSLSMAIDGSGTPYVAYPENANSNKITVMKYNGSSWVAVGSSGFSNSSAGQPKIAINSTGTPYVAFQIGGGSSKVTVMKYNGSSWVTVGVATISSSTVDYFWLAFSPKDVAYLVYADYANSQNATVKCYGNLWKGTSSTVWGTGTNWSAGSAPASTDDAVIPYGCTNYPNITSILTPVCNNLTIESSSASVTVGTSGMLSIYGSITNGGTFTATSGKIKMAGSSAQTIPASVFSSNTIQDLEISNSAGVTLSGTLGLTGTLTPTSGTFTTGGYFTLKSSASATGRIAAGSGSYLSGNVTLERYIPGGRRVFRYLGNPTTAALSLSNLQDDIYVTGTGGNTNGFDATQNQNPSAFWYDNTSGSVGSWTAINNTTSDLNWTSQRGLRILVRGDRTQPNTLTGGSDVPNAVTLDITGALKTGNQSISLTNANAYHLLANPYTSPTDIGSVINSAGVNMGTQYWVWDPQSGTRGAYVAKLRVGGAYSIPSMSSFIVLPTGSATLAFTESNKTSAETGTNNYFRTNNSIADVGELKLLYNGYPSDNIFIRRDDANAVTAFDAQDGKKLWNPDMSIYFVDDSGDSLSVDSRPFTNIITIPLGFTTNVTAAGYAIQLDSWGINGYELYLKDKLLNTEQKLLPGDVYNFTTSVGAVGTSRFDIVLRPSAILPLSALQLTAQQKGNDIRLQWNITGEETAVRYEVEYSRDGRSFEKIATQNVNGAKAYSWLHASVSGTTHYYRIKSIAVNGTVTYSAVVKVNTAKADASISIYPNPVNQGDAINISLNNLDKGDYQLKVIDATGKIIQQKQIEHTGGYTTITFPGKLPSGIYNIVLENSIIHLTGQLMVK